MPQAARMHLAKGWKCCVGQSSCRRGLFRSKGRSSPSKCSSFLEPTALRASLAAGTSSAYKQVLLFTVFSRGRKIFDTQSPWPQTHCPCCGLNKQGEFFMLSIRSFPPRYDTLSGPISGSFYLGKDGERSLLYQISADINWEGAFISYNAMLVQSRSDFLGHHGGRLTFLQEPGLFIRADSPDQT